MVARGEKGRGMGKMGNGRYKLPVMECISNRNKRHRKRNIVDDIVIVLYDDRW